MATEGKLHFDMKQNIINYVFYSIIILYTICLKSGLSEKEIVHINFTSTSFNSLLQRPSECNSILCTGYGEIIVMGQ